MKNRSSILSTIGYVAAGIAAVAVAIVAIPTIFAGFLLIFGGFIGLFFLFWALGFKITITQGGQKTGYVRWFKFYPYTVMPFNRFGGR